MKTNGTPLAARGIRRHFDELAHDYDHQIPPHLQRHYLERKLRHLAPHLGPRSRPLLGLDLGCGLGIYAREVVDRFPVKVVAADASTTTLRRARHDGAGRRRLQFAAIDALRLPFPDETFDFAYAINLVHHLPADQQAQACNEAARVLRAQGRFFLFEINVRNPVFRWYMRHVFPRRRHIDRGDEDFVHPDRLPNPSHLLLEGVDYFTFLPDFLPPWTLPAVRRVEALLERSPLAKYSIHYVAAFRKKP